MFANPSGFDRNSQTSCTTTTCVVYYFLADPAELKSIDDIGYLHGKKDFEQLPVSKEDLNDLVNDLSPDRHSILFSFHTKDHKFSILLVGGEACILQSNQFTTGLDDTGNKQLLAQFTFEEYLTFPVLTIEGGRRSIEGATDPTWPDIKIFTRFKSRSDLVDFFNAIRVARTITDDSDCSHDKVYKKYFGLPLKFSRKEDEFWFTAVEPKLL